MPKRIVDAYDEDGKVTYSYPIVLNHMNMPLNEDNIIQEAIKCHEEDGLNPLLIKKWVVRDPRPDDA